MRNFNKKKLVKVLRNANISASNAPPKTTKKKVLDKKKYVPEWKKKSTNKVLNMFVKSSAGKNLYDSITDTTKKQKGPPSQSSKKDTHRRTLNTIKNTLKKIGKK
jgi:2,3-bisphosphoglycerate-independent phosphoglycerate mutase